MIKRITVVALVAALLLTIASPIAANAESGIKVTDSFTEAVFPYLLTFNIEAESDAEINEIRLHYRVERDSFARVTSEVDVQFTAGKSVSVGWTMEMIKSGGFPAGTVIDYWWTLEDNAGSSLQTEIYQLQFNDERYDWNSLTEGNISLYWYSGDQSFARQIMDATQVAMQRVTTDTGAYLEKPVRLYIYASSQDLLGAIIFPQEWTGGVAYTTFGVVAIGINENNIEWGKRAIVHELMHLVTHQVTHNPYNYLPVWLNEGLSMYAEGEMGYTFESYLQQAVLNDRLISVRSLSSPFSADARISYQSYAQSMSLVEYLIEGYGQDKMLALLNTFRQGSTYDSALMQVYGFDMDGLNELWREYIMAQYAPAAAGVSGTVSAAVLAAIAAAIILAGLVCNRLSWRRA
ncbi:peptidase MA family metallohydrolase [Chloroflexota bacterium]